MSKISLNIKGRKVNLIANLFEDGDDIDIDKILRIDYINIAAEVLTFSAILNRLGILLAEVDNEYNEAELDFKVWCSKKKESIREKWDNDPERKIVRGYKYTIDQVQDALEVHPLYLKKKENLNRLLKQKSILNSVYWSAKSKDNRLTSFDKLITEDRFEDLDNEEFNGIKIRIKKPLIG